MLGISAQGDNRKTYSNVLAFSLPLPVRVCARVCLIFWLCTIPLIRHMCIYIYSYTIPHELTQYGKVLDQFQKQKRIVFICFEIDIQIEKVSAKRKQFLRKLTPIDYIYRISIWTYGVVHIFIKLNYTISVWLIFWIIFCLTIVCIPYTASDIDWIRKHYWIKKSFICIYVISIRLETDRDREKESARERNPCNLAVLRVISRIQRGAKPFFISVK